MRKYKPGDQVAAVSGPRRAQAAPRRFIGEVGVVVQSHGALGLGYWYTVDFGGTIVQDIDEECLEVFKV